MEFARIPCFSPLHRELPAFIPMIPALAVVCASEPSVSKLMRPFSDAVFTTTPWLAFRYGPRRAGEKKNQVYFFPQIAVPFLIGDVFEPVEVRHRGVVERDGCMMLTGYRARCASSRGRASGRAAALAFARGVRRRRCDVNVGAAEATVKWFDAQGGR